MDAAQYIAPILNMQSVGEREHFVQFYEHDDYLVHSMAAYVANGLAEGAASVIIATKEHREALESHLASAGIDVAEAQKCGLYCAYDAESMLSRFMHEGHPDAKRFRALFGPILETASVLGVGVRAFGEMVALLWAEGNKLAAIELEFLWNDLADHHSFALMCAYPIDQFTDDEKAKQLRHICGAHACVIPHETYYDTFKSAPVPA
jgi:hypothetical protein